MALNMESCSREEACASYRTSEKLFTELREKLQDWLKFQPHLPQDVPQEILENLILASKMSLEQAKQKLDMYYTIKRLAPDFFANRDPRGSRFANLHSVIKVAYLPKLSPEKYRVSVARIGNIQDPSKTGALDFLRYCMLIEEILLTDQDTRSLGHIYIFDLLKITFGFVATWTPTVLKKSEVIFTQVYAKGIKQIHFVNTTPIAHGLISLVKKVLKPKLAARIYVHSKEDYESLYQHIPKAILPKDYGGTEPSLDQLAELWYQKVNEKRDWFLEQEKVVVDERLRPGPPVDGENLFGFSGSFQTLDVD